jgi:hypothetical protein
MARVSTPGERELPTVSSDDQAVFRQYGAAMLAGDAKAAKLAQTCLFGPSLVRLFETAFAELAELTSAAEGLEQLQAQHDACDREVRRLMLLRPAGLEESERVQARIDELHRDAAPIRARLNSAQTAAMQAGCIASFLGDLLPPAGARTVRYPLAHGCRTAELASEMGVDPAPNGWQMLLRPDPRPRRRAFLRGIR